MSRPSGLPGVGVVERPGMSSGTSDVLLLLFPVSFQDMVVKRGVAMRSGGSKHGDTKAGAASMEALARLMGNDKGLLCVVVLISESSGCLRHVTEANERTYAGE
jgi:hypothetical protein